MWKLLAILPLLSCAPTCPPTGCVEPRSAPLPRTALQELENVQQEMRRLVAEIETAETVGDHERATDLRHELRAVFEWGRIVQPTAQAELEWSRTRQAERERDERWFHELRRIEAERERWEAQRERERRLHESLRDAGRQLPVMCTTDSAGTYCY